MYSVMQSDRNSFWGEFVDIVFESVNIASRDKDSIVDQIYEEKIYLDCH